MNNIGSCSHMSNQLNMSSAESSFTQRRRKRMYETKKQMVIVFQSNTFFPAYLDLHLRGVYEIKYISSKSY